MTYMTVFLGGLFLTFLLVYPVKSLASALGAIATPGGRSVHSSPMPLMGGFAIYLSCLIIGLSFLAWNDWNTSLLGISSFKLMGLFLGASFLLLVGIFDDIRPLRARWKLLGQLIAILIPVLFGFTIQAVHLPFVGTINLGAFGILFFVLWVLGITNAINLIDGLDGLASIVCFFAAVGNGIIALTMGNAFIAFFSFMLAGCLLGFLFHNFPPAQIFLGDTGSMLLGFLLAVAVIESNTQKRTTTLLVLAPLLLLGFSLLDVFLSVVRRFLSGKPVFASDLGHIHHRLMARFRNTRRVLFVASCFSMFMVLVSIVTHYSKFISSTALGMVWVGTGLITIMFVRLLGYFRTDRIRYVLKHREDLKFFSSLLSYLHHSLPKVKTQEALLKEFNWVCQAIKPSQARLLNPSQEVIYCFVSDHSKLDMASNYREKLTSEDFILEWSHFTQNDEPTTCDIRLVWRELFGLFAQQMNEVIHGTESPAPVLHFSNEESTSLQSLNNKSSKSKLLSKGLLSGTQLSGS